MLYILIEKLYICTMEKITLSFNTPVRGQVTIKLGENSTVLTNKEYRNLIEPSISDSPNYMDWVRINIQNYFKQNLVVTK